MSNLFQWQIFAHVTLHTSYCEIELEIFVVHFIVN